MSAQRRPPAETRFNVMVNSPLSRAARHLVLSGNLESIPARLLLKPGVGYVSANWEGVTASAMRALGYKDKRSDLFGANVIVSCGLFAAALSIQNVHVSDGINDQHHVET